MAPNLRCVLLTTFLMMVTTAGAGPSPLSDDYEEKECEVNHHCSSGFFCYVETNKCAPCISCSSRSRFNSTWECPQQASDCGECLPGYQEISLERGVEKESCTPIPDGFITTNKNSAPLPGASEHMLNLLWFFGGIGGLSLFVMASFLLAQWHRGRRSAEPQQASTELQELVTHAAQAPPPYSPFGEKFPTAVVNATPTAPSMDSTLQVDSPRNCDARIYVETHASQPPPVDHVNLVQTELFQTPDWVNDTHCTGLRQSTPPSTENSTDGPELHDDNTQPSDWTPNTSQENVEESGNHLMSFHTPPQLVGSTAVGTVSELTNIQDNRVRRREENSAESQESCEDAAPDQKRLRSSSPPPEQARNFHPEVLRTQSNTNVNSIQLQSLQTSTIQINLNLNRVEDHRADSELDSEDFLA